MQYRYFGRTGMKVSALCLGTMTFGNESDEKTAHALLDRFWDAGGNFIDTANMYQMGLSEEITGRWIKHHRQDLVLATKFRFRMSDQPNDIGASRYTIMRAVEDSLRRLQVDAIDLYQIHCWDPATPLEETLRALDDLVHQGKVRYLGASNFAGWQLAQALGISERLGLARFDCLQPQYSLIERGIEYELVPLCLDQNIAMIPWSPLGGGFLTGKYSRAERPDGSRLSRDIPDSSPLENIWGKRATERNWAVLDIVRELATVHEVTPAQVAIAWTLAQPGVTSTIIGARHVGQLEDNLGALGITLSKDDLARLDAASANEDIYPYRFIRDLGAR